MVQRRECLPRDFRLEGSHSPLKTAMFCASRPCATTAIYRYDNATRRLRLLNPIQNETMDTASLEENMLPPPPPPPEEEEAPFVPLPGCNASCAGNGKQTGAQWLKVCAANECAACAQCPQNQKRCLAWCSRTKDGWEDKCGDADCAACATCYPCEQWCLTNPTPWDTKCEDQGCAGCDACPAKESHRVVEYRGAKAKGRKNEETGEACQNWCELQHAWEWDQKCADLRCAKCDTCKSYECGDDRAAGGRTCVHRVKLNVTLANETQCLREAAWSSQAGDFDFDGRASRSKNGADPL